MRKRRIGRQRPATAPFRSERSCADGKSRWPGRAGHPLRSSGSRSLGHPHRPPRALRRLLSSRHRSGQRSVMVARAQGLTARPRCVHRARSSRVRGGIHSPGGRNRPAVTGVWQCRVSSSSTVPHGASLADTASMVSERTLRRRVQRFRERALEPLSEELGARNRERRRKAKRRRWPDLHPENFGGDRGPLEWWCGWVGAVEGGAGRPPKERRCSKRLGTRLCRNWRRGDSDRCWRHQRPEGG